MESLLLSFFLTVFSAVVAILYFLGLLPFHTTKDQNKVRKSPPKAAGDLPFIGHLPLLSGPTPLHITLFDMADKYGPIFSLRLGARRVVVVSSLEMAKECLKTNDVNFSNRPGIAAMDILGYNGAMFLVARYGHYWREMRKVSMLNLLSNKKVSILASAREREVDSLIRSLFDNVKNGKGEVVDMTKIFSDLTLSLMVRTVVGDVEKNMDSTEKEKWRELVREFFRLITAFSVSDVLPNLKWFDEKFSSMHTSLRKVRDNLDSTMQTWLQQHRIHRKTTSDSIQEFDFMGEMLSISEGLAPEFPIYDADTINKATCGAMMLAGADTTSLTLTWALCLLLNNPHTIRKAQEELDNHVGRSRLVRESDLDNLLYIQTIVKETLRLHPTVTLIPREAAEDCIVAGYHLPAGTRLFVNVWKIQRDPLVWSDPLEFKPERFLTNPKIDNQGLEYGFLAFGDGRRVCPGISLALQTTQLTLANLLHCFDLSTASGGAMDMAASPGATNSKATSLEVVLSPRLTTQIYA